MKALLPATTLLMFLLPNLPGSASAQATPRPTHTPPQRVTMPASALPHLPEPEVHKDGSITFHFLATGAKVVELDLEGADPQLMTKAADGSWSATTAPLLPQIYGYRFKADGVPLLDPTSVTVKTNLLSLQNMIEVPGTAPMPWDDQNVPHGMLHHHFYRSATLGRQSDFYVYTPPNYDPKTRYPVLYLLHGYSDDASGWTAVGRAHLILDSLIAQGKAKPMIVVMPLGYGTMEFIERHWDAWDDHALVDRNLNRFTQVLLYEVKPEAERFYSVSPDRKDHAIAGLSMGGGESLNIGLNHPDQFAYVGAFSSAVKQMNYEQTFPDLTKPPDATRPRVKLLWVACGTSDELITPNRAFIRWVKQHDIPVTAIETPGRHTWMVWRDNLLQFAPLLFRD